MTTAILIFFMKAGFLFLETAFATQVTQRRRVIMTKYMDTCSSALAFFFFGFAVSTRQEILGESKDYIFWFFRFTFASNTATIIGGVLIADERRMRLIAVFLYAFCSSAIFHPMVARWTWSSTFSPLKYCNGSYILPHVYNGTLQQIHGVSNDVIVLDYAGAGAVHLLGGMAGLILTIFHKFDHFWKKRKNNRSSKAKSTVSRVPQTRSVNGSDSDPLLHHQSEEYHATIEFGDSVPEDPAPAGSFIDFMYPTHGGSEHPEYAALGMLILWTTWFAFNCGSTEDVSGMTSHYVTGRIAVVMVLSGGAGGILAMFIAVLAQLKTRGDSVNTGEIANGILSCLVAVTGCAPYVPPTLGIVIGLCAVLFYHLGCYVEYKFNLHDTARVVPVHAFNGLWGMLATGIFADHYYIKQTVTNVCYCISVELPEEFITSRGLRFAYQLAGSFAVIGWALAVVTALFFILWILPFDLFVNIIARLFCLNSKDNHLDLKGSFLFTEPHESLSSHHQPSREGYTSFNEYPDNGASGPYHCTDHRASTQPVSKGVTRLGESSEA